MPVNYQNGAIYKIWSPSHPDEVYIGSTAESRFSARMSKHRCSYKRFQEGKGDYNTCYKILAYEDARMDLIEKYPCNDKSELHAREGYYIRTLDCVNKTIPGRTRKEYLQYNRDKITQYHKQYRQDNRDRTNQHKKKHYQKNKDKIKARMSEKVTCDCGLSSSRGNLLRHKKSKRHLQALKTAEHLTT